MQVRGVLLAVAVVLGCVGCASRRPTAIVRNDEHGILRVLTPGQMRRIGQMVAGGVPESKRDNVEVWPDDTIWYRVYAHDGEGCYRLRYEFHPSFRKVKVYPEDYTLFPGSVVESAQCVRILEPARPAFMPFDEKHHHEIMRVFAPASDWSGFR